MSEDERNSKKEPGDGSFKKPAAIDQALAALPSTQLPSEPETEVETNQSKSESETEPVGNQSKSASELKSAVQPETKQEAAGFKSESALNSEAEPQSKAKTDSSAESVSNAETGESKTESVLKSKVEPAVVTMAGGAKSGFSICELGVSVLLLAILSFLFVNVSVLFLAKRYNDDICRTSIGYAGDAATRGLDTREVCIAAFKGMDKCGIGGFFIEHPRICLFKDDITSTVRTLTISTSTKALLPSPFLIADRSVLDADGQHRTFTTTYVFKLNNPKNCGDTFNIIGPDGKLRGPASRYKKKTEEKVEGKTAEKTGEKLLKPSEKSSKKPAAEKDAATGGAR